MALDSTLQRCRAAARRRGSSVGQQRPGRAQRLRDAYSVHMYHTLSSGFCIILVKNSTGAAQGVLRQRLRIANRAGGMTTLA